ISGPYRVELDPNNHTVSFVATCRGNTKIIIDGYSYTRHHTYNNHTHWRCAKSLWYEEPLKPFNEVIYGKTKAGRPKITFDGFSYSKHYRTGSKSVWRCSSNFGKCPAKLFTSSKSTKVEYNFVQHNHSPEWF
ncbi:uncharacterized protein LOC115264239, partial [Aedes albopictus]|uniref:FLYWCH-type domain-containing protein n=1 Tax=Aedes albopictus TaxID=7160 RepID=A0ABM1ZQK1_AEDAL